MKEAFNIREIAAALNIHLSNAKRRAVNSGWNYTEQTVRGGIQRIYHLNDLPDEVQAQLLLKYEKPEPVETIDNAAMWLRFEHVPDSMKDKAKTRLGALHAYEALINAGTPRTKAAQLVSDEFSVNNASLYRWIKAIKGVHKADWLAALIPQYHHANNNAEISDQAWEFFKADYLRLERPTIAACYQRLERAAAENCWTIPSLRTINRWATTKIHSTTRVLKRAGEIELMTRYPSIERSVAEMHALEWINGDGYLHNVFVKWPDGTIDRPKTWFWQDIKSRRILNYRVDMTENTDTIRLSFGDLVEQYGIPEHATIDNTRAAANKWMTGQVKNRYRFKIKEDDPMGIFPMLGVQVHWTSVNKAGTQAKGHGQAKPIERAFGVGGLGEYVDKHPKFAGAFTGENTSAKPENYGETAVPLEVFVQVLNQEIIAWNARKNRRTEMGAGVHSFDDVFNTSYSQSVIKKPTTEQRRLWLLAAESVTVKRDGTFTMQAGARTGQRADGRNRYYLDALQEYGEKKQKIVVRFDPDQLHERAYAYTLNGQFIGEAQCIEALGFGDQYGGRVYNKHRRQFIKATKAAAAAETRMTLADAIRYMPTPELPDAPAPVATQMAKPAMDVTPAQPPQKLASHSTAPIVIKEPAKQETQRQRYMRWVELDKKITANQAVTEKEAKWHKGYQTTSEFFAEDKLARDFGLANYA